jgi:hypothetical protein
MKTMKDFRTCTECHRDYSIHQNHLGGNAAWLWHEGHIACVRPMIQPNAPQEVLDSDALSIAYNKSIGYNGEVKTQD